MPGAARDLRRPRHVHLLHLSKSPHSPRGSTRYGELRRARQRYAARRLHFFRAAGPALPLFPSPSKRGNGAPGGAGPSDVGPCGPAGPPRALRRHAAPHDVRGGGASRRSTRDDASGPWSPLAHARPSLHLRPQTRGCETKSCLFLLCSHKRPVNPAVRDADFGSKLKRHQGVYS